MAAKTGRFIARYGLQTPPITRTTAASVVRELADAAVRAEAPVREVTGLADGLPVPAALVVDRPGWITAAAESMAAVTNSDPDGVGLLAGKPAGVQAGAMLAFLSTAVLGQYDPFRGSGELDSSRGSGELDSSTGDDGTLLLVAPNIVAVERSLRLHPSDFRLWVCLHEVTHRVQFSAVPWLAGYLRDTVDILGENTDEPLAEIIPRLVAAARERKDGVIGLLRATQAPAQQQALDRLLMLGTLLEGHADHVMDAVGPAVVPSVEHIRHAFDQRRKRGANPIQRVLRALLGMDAKIAQYVRGKAFVDAVVAEVGMSRFNTIWTAPDTLPVEAEIADPRAWVSRVLGA